MNDFIHKITDMQKLFTLLIMTVFSCTTLFAQDIHTLTATVTRTKHNVAVTNDLIIQGSFYFKEPGKMCITFDDGKEMLLMDGNNSIMINDDKSSVAKGKEASHLRVLQDVLQNILSDRVDNIDTVEATDMEITRQDNIISIIPIAANAKAMRRMMFTSFIVTIDPNSSGLKSMYMNEKGGNYTQYDFSDFVFNETIDDNIFHSKF